MTRAAVAAALGCSCGVYFPPFLTGRKCEDEDRANTTREAIITNIEIMVEIDIGIELKVGIEIEIETELEIVIEIDIDI